MTDEPSIFINFSHRFAMVRVIGRSILPVVVKISVSVTPAEDAEDSEMLSALTKVKFWLDQIAARSIAFDSGNEMVYETFLSGGASKIANFLMITPGEPTDELLAALFQSKFNALGGNRVDFDDMHLDSENDVGLAFTFAGNAADVLPSITEWVGERHYYEVPWWSRDDGTAMDAAPAEDADLTIPPKWAIRMDVTPRIEAEPTTGHKAFKPTIIPGGKDD